MLGIVLIDSYTVVNEDGNAAYQVFLLVTMDPTMYQGNSRDVEPTVPHTAHSVSIV